MKRFLKISKLALMLMTAILLVANSPVRAASNAPFIYYYSHDAGAFIVERADGSEHRTLANFSLPRTGFYLNAYVSGPGWSHSGKWFTWTSNMPFGSGGERDVYLVRRDGMMLPPVLQKNVQVRWLLWSPASDLLLVSYNETASEESPDTFVIYSPEQQKIILQYDVAAPDWATNVRWSQDGKFVAIANFGYIAVLNLRSSPPTHTTINNVGNQIVQITAQTTPFWLNTNLLAYLSGSTSELIIEDLLSTKRERFKLPNGTISRIDWSPDGNYALVYVSLVGIATDDVWLLDRSQEALIRLGRTGYYVGSIEPFETLFPHSAWNSRNQAYILTENKHLQVLSVNPISQVEIPGLKTGEVEISYPIQWHKDRELYFVWDEQGDKYPKGGVRLLSYSHELGSVVAIAPTNGYFKDVSGLYYNFLADGSLMYIAPGAYRKFADGTGDYNGTAIAIVDSRTTQLTSIALSDALYIHECPFAAVYVRPHPTENWLFVQSENYENENHVAVLNQDGTVQRLLTRCDISDSKSCFGWLPDVQN